MKRKPIIAGLVFAGLAIAYAVDDHTPMRHRPGFRSPPPQCDLDCLREQGRRNRWLACNHQYQLSAINGGHWRANVQAHYYCMNPQ